VNSILPAQILRTRRHAFLVALAAAVLCAIGGVLNRPQFFHSWLVAWIFFTGISCGALVIVMMQFLTGGDWGFAVQRLAEAAMLTLPLMALLFVPVLIGVHDIFPWCRGGESGSIQMSPHNQGYLNVPFFAARGFFYFAVLIALAWSIRHWSVRQDQGTGSRLPGKRLRALSGGGLVAYVLCMNFASTDWIVSLEPDWYSTMLVIIFMAGQFLSALALMTVLLALFAGREPFAGVIKTKHFHDLGNLLLTFVIFWTYVSFSQFLIIWSGNLPKEISWYLHRTMGGWKEVALLLTIFQFALPVALLLQRGMKRRRERLAAIAVMILVLNVVNVYWLIAPAFHPEGVRIHWLDFATLIAIGGLWTDAFLWILGRQPLLPMHPEEELRHV
jgi:Ni/Fe-hydrogenase subunit HybB-like protein